MLAHRLSVAPVSDDRKHHADVVLINMPFGPPLFPSIGLGLLKAALTRLDISARVLYFNIPFAKKIGFELYEKTFSGEVAFNDLLGEWIFAAALFGSSPELEEAYIEDVLRGRSPAHRDAYPNPKPVSEAFIEDIRRIRRLVEPFLDECAAEVLALKPKIACFTSTFHQHVPALALAQRLKAQNPAIFIELGGANCQGSMGIETLRQFPFVDAVISGEGDEVFPKLVQRILQQQPCSDLPGVCTRDNLHVLTNLAAFNAPAIHDLDALPLPDYDDYIEQLQGSGLAAESLPTPPHLLLETSRGCWWGEKMHCTFCGLNGAEMAYRAKSSSRALSELAYIAEKYPGYPIFFVDNILDMKYFKDFVPEVAARQLNLGLFYEVKANLRKEQVRLLRDAGITLIQPGIESLSDKILTLMRKGVKGLQNIQLLKWCKEFGVTPFWNILWGFPGEDAQEYARMAELMPLLTHLYPPAWAGLIRIDRFSPNFLHAEEFGFAEVQPFPAYAHIYPFAEEILYNLAYFFDFKYQQPQDIASYTQPVAEQVTNWQETHNQSELFCSEKGDTLQVWDLRPVARQLLMTLHEPLKTLYIACDAIRSTPALRQLAKEYFNREVSAQEIEEMLHPLVELGVMVKQENSYLALAVAEGEYEPQPQAQVQIVSQITKGGLKISQLSPWCQVSINA